MRTFSDGGATIGSDGFSIDDLKDWRGQLNQVARGRMGESIDMFVFSLVIS